MKNKKQVIAIIVIATLICLTVIGNGIVENILNVSFADDMFMDDSGVYIITNDKKMEVQFADVFEDSATSVVIPATIKINGQEYKVIGIKAEALKGNKKIKKVTIDENVKSIGKKAFYGCKNLKNVTINTFNLKAKTIGTAAFKGLNAKAVVSVPGEKLAAYKKILKAKGLAGKNQKIIGEKEEKKEEEVPEVTFGPDHPLPEPEEAIASIGNIAKIATKDFDKSKVSETVKYAKGDNIMFSARIQMHPEIYGQFGTREAYGIWLKCYKCSRKFSNEEEYTIHDCMSNCGYRFEFINNKEAYIESYWAADDSPCKTVFHFTLPSGLSYKEDSIKLIRAKDIEIDSSVYNVEISGQELTVTIDDIKAMPYFSYSFETSEYGGFRYPISVLFNAEMNDATTVTNAASAYVSYEYKGMEKTIDLGELNVYAASLQLNNVASGSKFTLYKQKIVYNASNIGAPQYFEIAEAENINSLLTFSGLGKGKYKLVQTEAPDGHKKMNSLIFDIDMEGKNGKITELSVKDKSGKKLSWNTNIETGVISAIVTNQ
ncbi:MAG: leucine-rich repeat protein [Lachnospiraceae bacterium]